MLELKERTVKLYAINNRVEIHGADQKPAIDLGIEWSEPNTILDALGKNLRTSLFMPAEDAPEELDLNVDVLPVVRNPKLKMPIAIDHQQVGMRAHVAYGIDESTAIVLGMVKLHKPKVTAVAFGGTVQMRMMLSTTDVDERSIGKLALLQGHEITLTLTQPEVAAEPELTPQDVGLQPLGPEDAPPTATDIFMATTAEEDGETPMPF